MHPPIENEFHNYKILTEADRSFYFTLAVYVRVTSLRKYKILALLIQRVSFHGLRHVHSG